VIPVCGVDTCRAPLDLKVDDTLAVRMPDVRRLGLVILKGCIASGALALGMLLTGAANQPGVANGSVAAQMRNDGEVIYDADPFAHFFTQCSLFRIPRQLISPRRSTFLAIVREGAINI
jgi:hypothetical protein